MKFLKNLTQLNENEEGDRIAKLKQDIADGKTVKVVMASYSKGHNSIGDLEKLKLVKRNNAKVGNEMHRTYEVLGDVKFTVSGKPKLYKKGSVVDAGYWDPT